MANFDLYINKIEENIDDYRRYKNKCLDDISYSYGVLENVDASWVDHNTDNFLDKLEKDQKTINEYFSYLDKLYNQIEQFKNDIVSVLHRYGCNGSINSLSFDNARRGTCINYIESSIYYINQSINKILSIVYPADFSKLDLVNEILRNLYSLNDDLNNCSNDISNLSNSIFDEISNYRSNVSRIGNFNAKFDISSYNWSNVDLDTDLSKFAVDEEEENKASSKEIDDQNRTTVSGLNNNIDTQNAENEQIDDAQKTVVEGLHNNYEEEYADELFVDEKVSDAPTGLNKNVELGKAGSNKTNEDILDKIEGLNDKLALAEDKKEILDTKLEDEITGLSRNIEEQKANSVDFDIDKQELELGKVEEYSKRENSLETSNHFDIDGNISVSVYDNNSKTIDMESSSSYNVGDGIKVADDISGTKVNVNSSNGYDVASNINREADLNFNSVHITNDQN